ncbi:MAG: hypothetical protein ACKO6N_07315 [Myxococcota bacterium]
MSIHSAPSALAPKPAIDVKAFANELRQALQSSEQQQAAKAAASQAAAPQRSHREGGGFYVVA